MELTPSSGKAFTNAGQTMGYRISNENAGFIMDILATKLYTDPLMAPPREIITNAFDAHLMSGKQDVPVRITPPHKKDLNFRVRDFGPGLSPEQMESFFSFGDSNKRHSNEATGGFGIGSKSPFAIADSFTTNIFYDGMQYLWQSFKKDGRPHSACLLTAPTDQPSGVEVIIPIAEKDLMTFHAKLRDFLTYCQSRYELIFPLEVQPPTPILFSEQGTPVLYGTKGSSRIGTMVRMGDICYKLPVSMKAASVHTASGYGVTASLQERNWLDSITQDYNTFIYDMPIGSLAISPNREEIIDSEKNRKAVKEHTTKVIDAALKYRWKEYIKDLTTDTTSFLYFFFQTLGTWRSNAESIAIYVFNNLSKEFSHLKLEEYLSNHLCALSHSNLQSRDLFLRAVMQHQKFIEDTGLIYLPSDGTAAKTPSPGDININDFLHWDRLRHKETTLSVLDNEARKALYTEYFGKSPLDTTTYNTFRGSPGRYCPDGDYKALSGRYFVTKPLSEIKEPFYRWVVATMFVTPPLKNQAGTFTGSSSTRKGLVVVAPTDPPKVHAFNTKTSMWEEITSAPATPFEFAVIVRYSTGPSYVFSQDPFFKKLTEYPRSKPPTTDTIRRLTMTTMHHTSGAVRLIALKEGQTLPTGYATESCEISEWFYFSMLMREPKQLLGYVAVPSKAEKYAGHYCLQEILPPKDHDFCVRRMGVFAQADVLEKPTFKQPPSCFDYHSAKIINQSDYEYRVIPISKDNTKLVEHLNKYYSLFFDFGNVGVHSLNAYSGNLCFQFLIDIKNLNQGTAVDLLSSLTNSQATLYGDTHPMLFRRYLPYFIYDYYDMDISKPPELSYDLLKRYTADVIDPFMAAVQYRLEKR